jgi:translocation and assembly module TamB
VTLALGDHVFFKGFDVTAFLGGSLEVRQKPGLDALARGEVVCREGRYRGMGQDLLIDPGRLVFSGPLLDPTIDALAYRRAVDHTKAGFKVTGRLSAPQVDLYSDPMKSEQDIMAYILFGRSANAGSESEQLKASEAAAYLGGNLLASQAASKVGLDEARIDPGYTGNDAALVAGKYISPQLFVGYGTGLFETLHTLRVRYIVSTHISLEAETGTRETADVIYQIERGK